MNNLRTHILRRLLLLAAALLTLPGIVTAQSDPQLTQYWALPAFYNAGAAGASDYLRVRGGTRMQWIGIDGAPQSFFIQADSPLAIGRKRIGLGVQMQQEKIGLFSNMLLGVQGAYKFKLFKGELSAGFQLGYFNQKFSGSKIENPGDDDYHQPDDEAIPKEDLNGSAFDLGVGIFYTKPRFWVGVSSTHLLKPTIKMSLQGSENTETQEFESELGRMVYFMGGCNFPIKNTLFVLEPSALVKTDFNFFTAEVTMRATYNRFLTFGVAYRYNDAVSAMIGATFRNFFLGYSYDYPLSAIVKVSSGSHEIVAGYQLKLDFSGKNKNKHRSIRIM